MAVTDEGGSVAERLAYDPFGKRRYVSGAADPNNVISGVTVRHGYTSHEMLDGVRLTNMNGRMYDPELARFISADPNIQSPYNLQSYNRYSYAWNNPMIGIDPSGYSFWTDFRDDILKPAVAIAVAVYAPQISAYIGWTSAAGSIGISGAVSSGMLGGALAGGIMSGTAQGALIGGLTGGAFGYAGNNWPTGFGNAASHAVIGCASSSLSGGGCGSGALSGGFGSLATQNMPEALQANHLYQFAYVTVVGGTASVIGGGKFANGAETAAYGYLFNHVAHNGFTLRNPNVLRNLNALNQKLVDMGYDDAKFELSVTGGDRYRDSEGNIRSATDNSIVEGASSRSPHLYERGARAVDLDVRGVSNTNFDTALRSTQFDPSSTARNYPNAPHTHINLYNRKSLYYFPSE